MKRRVFMTMFAGAATWSLARPLVAHAQNQPGSPSVNQDAAPQTGQPAGQPQPVGQIATLQGPATVTRGNTTPSNLKVSDVVYRNDVLQTGANGSLGVTFDDETTLSLSANARIVVNDYVYEEGAKGNKAVFNVARGTVAFVASLVAKTGNMTITTPTATLGIRGTTGVVDVPDSTAAGASEARIKLYPDADGRVGRIEVFNPQGARLGALTQGASAFAIRPGLGGRFAAVPFQIPPQEAARDRGVVQRLFASHNIGRQLAIQRRQVRGPNNLRRNNLRPNNLQPNNVGPNNRQPPGAPAQRGGFRDKLRNLNPFAPKRKDQLR
jgi:FecR-like protein